MVGMRKEGAEVCHASYLLPFLRRRGTLLQVIKIAVIHTDDEVKVIEIFCRYRTGTMHQLITATGCMGTHSRVRKFPPMVTENTGRVNLKLRLTTGLM